MLMRRKPLIAAASALVLAGGAMLALRQLAPEALRGDAGAGCSAVDGLVDREQAKNEARSAVIQVLGSFALGYDRVLRTDGVADDIMESPSAVAESNASNCYQAELAIESLTERNLAIDFGRCPDESGTARVELVIPDPLGNGVDPDAPADDDAAPEPETTTVRLVLADSVRGGIAVDGSATLVDTEAGRHLTTDLNVEFLDYAGLLQIEGDVVHADDADTVTADGVFRSVSGLDWQLDAEGIVLSDSCQGARAGTLTLVYEGAGDPVVVEATFAGSCDGCAQVTVDDQRAPDICLPSEIQF